MIEVAEIMVHAADEPNVLAHLLDADPLAGEDHAEIDLLPIGADASVIGWIISDRQTPNSRFIGDRVRLRKPWVIKPAHIGMILK